MTLSRARQLARQITPDQLHWLFSAQLVLATLLGGTRQFLGPVVGAIAFVGLDEVASRWPFGRSLILGVLLIVVILVLPRGIAGEFNAARKFLWRLRYAADD